MCNSAGIDLCALDSNDNPVPLGTFANTHGDSMFYAATATVDPVGGYYVVTVQLTDGVYHRVVDIVNTSKTYGEMVANYSFPAQWFCSNMHALGQPDSDAPRPAAGTGQ